MSAARDALEEHASEFVSVANAEAQGSPVRESLLDTAALLLTAARKVGAR